MKAAIQRPPKPVFIDNGNELHLNIVIGFVRPSCVTSIFDTKYNKQIEILI